ncbi:ABC transporter substrate-binding protein [Nocardioides caldifontis]|uniref:ABC transporter substrate-binding protein n=1 Tax=Nocardioides caldifontis TaxID=2588938 RepID=UPI0011DF8275|nr:ABC transporter substrate-binding protein [Nocardioides caldifontis]
MRRSKFAAIGVAAVMAAGLAACGEESSGAGGSDGVFKVGFTSDLSGKYALNGVGQRDGFKAYFDYVNSQGGIDGHKVDVTYLDDASDLTRGTANTTQLMTVDRVSAIGGYILSNVCGAAGAIADANKVPINCATVTDDLMDPVQPYVYTARMVQSNEALPMVTLAEKLVDSDKPKVAIIVYASAASVTLQEKLEALVEEKGWELVASEQVPLTASDASAQTAKVIAAEPDVVLGALYDPLAVEFMRALKAKKVDIPFIDYDGASYTSGLLAVKDPNFHVFSSFSLDGKGEGEGLEQYRAALEAAGVDPTTPYVNNGYAQAFSIGEGLKQCGYPCTGEDMQKALDEQDVDTGGFAAGPMAYSPDDHEGMGFANFYYWDPASKSVKASLEGTPAGS